MHNNVNELNATELHDKYNENGKFYVMYISSQLKKKKMKRTRRRKNYVLEAEKPWTSHRKLTWQTKKSGSQADGGKAQKPKQVANL